MEVSKAVALRPKDVLKSNASHVAPIERWLPNAKAKHEKREATLVGYSGRVYERTAKLNSEFFRFQ